MQARIGEGNGNPLQCSCLENPRDGGAWWAAVCGVAQSRTRLKRLSGGSSFRQNGCEICHFHLSLCYSLTAEAVLGECAEQLLPLSGED